ncbi:putative surface protein with fasciclin (FAS1) repeats [Balneicella halophila]|uniref:Putative surface protein with fasciclin (FAS1) repeats n=1 Tax=Balneicella halophila TaxID=1537566 RepID=A0A7L4UQY4_BALHA|nr:fasciclin domain-containing protein [Balneicella halophila]PVX52079.1 putative surface protein with fasciclin (FAS1) repeats [Balneicella halophila]
MSKKFIVSFLLGLSLFSLLLIACNDDDKSDDIQEPNVYEIVKLSPSLSSFYEALRLANLDGTLANNNSLTVLAPTNDAFKKLFTALDVDSLNDIESDLLKTTLLNHMLNTTMTSADFTNAYENTSALGPDDLPLSLQVEVADEIIFNKVAKVTKADVIGTNGVVHVIDNVLLPNNLDSLIANNEDFSILNEALRDSRHSFDFTSVLSGSGPFTFFAPTNEAFDALFEANADWNSIGDIPIDVLESFLIYHIVQGDNIQEGEFQNGRELITLNGGTIIVSLTEGAQLKTTTNQTVNITYTDIQGINGVVHAIGSVLVP